MTTTTTKKKKGRVVKQKIRETNKKDRLGSKEKRGGERRIK